MTAAKTLLGRYGLKTQKFNDTEILEGVQLLENGVNVWLKHKLDSPEFNKVMYTTQEEWSECFVDYCFKLNAKKNLKPDALDKDITDLERSAGLLAIDYFMKKQDKFDVDIFIGVSAPNVLSEADIKAMAKDAIVFALANPDPEIDPVIARKHAAVVATGRSDQPNQINNVLVFPGIFRGLLDGNITKITDDMLIRAADAIASCVSSEQLNANFIVPSVFDQSVVQKVAAAVKKGG